MSTLAFYTVLVLAGGTDVLSNTFGLSLQSMLRIFQLALLVLPVGAGWATYKLCLELSRQRAHPIQQPVGGRIVRTPAGGYEVVAAERDPEVGNGRAETAAGAVERDADSERADK